MVHINSSEQLNSTNEYSKVFLQCQKWILLPGEYVLNSNQTLIYIPANRTYTFGNYKIHSDNSTYVCIPDELIPIRYMEWIFFGGWATSIFALLIAISLNIPCKRFSQRKYDFRPMFYHMISFVLAYIFLILYSLTYYSYMSKTWLIFIEYGAVYVDSTTYTWLSVVGFDTYRSLRVSKLQCDLSYSTKQFINRSIFAWGFPIILLTICVLMEHSGFYHHNFGMSLQGLQPTVANNILIYGMQVLILLIQFFFCLATYVNVRCELNKCSKITCSTIQKKKMLKIFFKLVFVMSSTCILAFVGNGLYFITKSSYSYILVIGITLQGVSLFLIHGYGPLKRKILKFGRKLEIMNFVM